VEQHRHIFVFAKLEPESKVRGIGPAFLDQNLASASFLDALLVEADGSRRLSMKAPLPHEPAMPGTATLVVPVVGIDALGQPLDERHVYGAEVIAQRTGHALGQPVTPQLIAAVLMHPQLGLKSIPPTARVAPLINKVSPVSLDDARQVANYLLTDLNIERVLLCTLQEDDPVREVRRRIGAVILGAGESRRMGEPKLLLPWGDKTIIREIAEQVTASGVYEVVVVAGRWEKEIRTQLAGLPLRVVHNPDYASGDMLSSLKVGVEALWHTSEACMVVLGDQPSIQQSTIQQVIEAYVQGKGRIIAPSYQNRRGHPILIDHAFWQSILDLPADAAPRDLIRANEQEIYHVVVDTDTVLRDIDTPEDYQRAPKPKNLPPTQP
jgi:molybdenum cofactor cytidylyltransferase